MVECPKCGAAVQPDWDWCHDCGFDPDGMQVKAASAASTAGVTGAAGPTGARQGGFGGQTQFTPPQATVIPPSMGPPQRRHGLEFLLIGSVVAVLAVVLIYFVTRGDK